MMISLKEYAENLVDKEKKEDFKEYLRCFTGYDVDSAKRTTTECKEIYTDFETKYREKMEYDEFVDIYFWEFVRQRQLSQISDKECDKNEALLRHAIRKRVEALHQTPMTFTEWKNFYNHEKDAIAKWETNKSAAFFETEIWPIVASVDGVASIPKQTLADLIEMAYEEGKRYGR